MTFNAGIIGSGRIGSEFDYIKDPTVMNTHAGAYTKHKLTDLIAVCDIDEKRLKKCKQFWDVPCTYTDHMTMLESEDLDILSICTRADMHLPIVKDAVEFDLKAIYCEKPIADSIKNAKEIIRLTKRSDIELFINHQRRFNPFFMELKAKLETEKLDRVQQASTYYTRGIANTGSHIFDLFNFLLGPAESVYAIKSQNRSNNKNDPNLDGIINYKNGTNVVLQACDDQDFLIFEIELLGRSWRIRIGKDVEYFNKKEVKHILGSNLRLLERVEKGFLKNKQPVLDMLDSVTHITNVLKGRANNISTGDDGLVSLELIVAFMEAGRSGGKKLKVSQVDKDLKIKSY